MILMDSCSCKGARPPKLKRENASLGQKEELCAATQEPEDPAQASPLMQIPVEYKECLHLFRKEGKAAFPMHQPWDHAIPIKPGKEVSFGLIYQLSLKELAMLRQYIDENLASG